MATPTPICLAEWAVRPRGDEGRTHGLLPTQLTGDGADPGPDPHSRWYAASLRGHRRVPPVSRTRVDHVREVGINPPVLRVA